MNILKRFFSSDKQPEQKKQNLPAVPPIMVKVNKKETTNSVRSEIDIDTHDFINPFEHVGTDEDSYFLYEKYLEAAPNKKLIEKIGENIVVSKDSPDTSWTRKEVLEQIACKLRHRSLPTIVQRDILNNKFGIILNLVSCSSEDRKSDLCCEIYNKWPIVFDEYMKVKVKQPGAIQVVKVIDKKYPLYVCSIFANKKDSSASTVRFLISALAKLRVKLKKSKFSHFDLPVYAQYDMGKSLDWDWDSFESAIMKCIPNTVICKK